MAQTNIFSERNRLSGTTCSKTPSDYLVKFESSLGYCIRAWSKYQPNDSLSDDRKQDLNWLRAKMRDYRLRIHSLSNRLEFWKGWQDGKHNRRTLPDKQAKSLAPILLEAFANTKAEQIYELGFQVGWRYARLKDYLLRVRKERKLEEAKQLQDYQQFFNLIRQNIETEDSDALWNSGSVPPRN